MRQIDHVTAPELERQAPNFQTVARLLDSAMGLLQDAYGRLDGGLAEVGFHTEMALSEIEKAIAEMPDLPTREERVSNIVALRPKPGAAPLSDDVKDDAV